MGIPGFFKWLTNRFHYPDIVQKCIEHPLHDENGAYHPLDETEPNLNGIEFDNLYLDMNGIIHVSMEMKSSSTSYSQEAIVQLIFDYIDHIFSIVRPRKLLYIAIDGVAPRAKLHQKRSKRFYELKETLDKAEEIGRIKSNILAIGNTLPACANGDENIESLDEQCITPGTSFMNYMNDCLRYYIYNRLNTKPAWKSLKVVFSDANVPGEGEHKIMNFIRRQCTQSGHDPETKHVLYGNDADLIILGLATHQLNVTIMRDDLNSSKQSVCEICRQEGHTYKECKGISKENQTLNTNSESNHGKTKYIFVHLSKLRGRLLGYLNKFKANCQTPFEWDFERFIDDWVFLCLLCGNDFLPDIPSFEIYQNSIDDLLKIYTEYVPQCNDYLTNNGQLNVMLLKNILDAFGQKEDHIFRERHQITQQWENNQQPSPVQMKPAVNMDELRAVNNNPFPTFRPTYSFNRPNPSTNNSTAMVNSSPIVSSNTERKNEMNDNVRLWEDGWHDRYYQKKFSLNTDQIKKKQDEIVEHYARGLCWILAYYYHGVPSWDWYYPYYYAPFSSDFTVLKDRPVRFTQNSKPFEPLEQIICLTSSNSVKYLPQQCTCHY